MAGDIAFFIANIPATFKTLGLLLAQQPSVAFGEELTWGETNKGMQEAFN